MVSSHNGVLTPEEQRNRSLTWVFIGTAAAGRYGRRPADVTDTAVVTPV